MALIRSRHNFDDHFTQIPNSWLRDQRLSFKAIGLLAQIMSHNPGWVMSIESLAKYNGVGKDQVRSAIKELEEVGYLVRTQTRTETQQFAETEWRTFDPNEPSLEKPSSENPTSANPTPKKNNLKEEQIKETNVHLDALFDEFWNVYPRKQNKIQAKKLYKTALTKCEHETLVAAANRYAKDPNRLDAYTKMASTWLANECWNDAPLPERIGASPAVDLEALRAKTAREKQATKELIASMAREGTPPPKCEHGNSIARCPRCLAK